MIRAPRPNRVRLFGAALLTLGLSTFLLYDAGQTRAGSFEIVHSAGIR